MPTIIADFMMIATIAQPLRNQHFGLSDVVAGTLLHISCAMTLEHKTTIFITSVTGSDTFYSLHQLALTIAIYSALTAVSLYTFI
ncbi:hypothetical protein J6590_042460 [Homalodisca vitripennis]|nr:hypothetical protein J6590_042460 [Homalodisca vitripennis]